MRVVLQNLTKKFPPQAGVQVGKRFVEQKHLRHLHKSPCDRHPLLLSASGLIKPTSGKIFFGEDDVTELPAEHRGIGLVFQNYALYPHLTVRQNILFPLQNRKGKDRLSKEEMEKKAEEAAALVQIGELMDRRPSELSGGQIRDAHRLLLVVRYENGGDAGLPLNPPDLFPRLAFCCRRTARSAAP